jgi:hypothetical protein
VVGTTLVEIRAHIEALASDDGEYYVVCGRTGDRPVPVAGKRFDGRATARSAARATEQYRTALRRYDPQLPCYDPIVCQDTDEAVPTARAQRRAPATAGREREATRATPDAASRPPEGRRRVEFCHRVSAALFETLAEEGYDDAETAVMDAYFDLAETVADPDELCLCLLESMAGELGRRLTPAEQADALAGAATRLPPPDPTRRPIEGTLSGLEDCGLLGRYTRSPGSVRLADGTRSVVVRLSGYALSPRDGSLPVLPITLELHRHRPDRPPSSLRVADVDEGWRITLVTTSDPEPSGLVNAPIAPEV